MYDNWVVLMAGGLGSRLKPLTDHCPKPMLVIGDKPVLETILENFMDQGFRHFCIAVHYKGGQIQSYFGDGSAWGADIQYIREESGMGTAGSLSRLPVKDGKPVLVMNGDILTKMSFEQILDFHIRQQAKATVAVCAYDFQVPYGVVKADGDRLTGFEEKPVYTSFINAGIYVFEPEILEKIPADISFNMDDLFEIMLKDGDAISIYPIQDYWIDIGKIEDFHQAGLDFSEVFK